jgi:NTP pyrophosphatase (non-canonical NTP hydrolase)
MAGMQQNGLAKLTEESGELQQVIGKMLQYPELQTDVGNNIIKPYHPDGTHLRTRLEEEMGDVFAAMVFVIRKLQLDQQTIETHSEYKLALFIKWDTEGS